MVAYNIFNYYKPVKIFTELSGVPLLWLFFGLISMYRIGQNMSLALKVVHILLLSLPPQNKEIILYPSDSPMPLDGEIERDTGIVTFEIPV